MLLIVRFIKNCPWSYSGGVLRNHQANDIVSVDEKTGWEMIKHGYAVLVEEMDDKPDYIDGLPKRSRKPKQSPENKMLDAESDENK